MRQVILYKDVEDGGWVAEVPSLPGCVSQGDTLAKALKNVRAAIAAWIAAAEQLDRPIPSDSSPVELHNI